MSSVTTSTANKVERLNRASGSRDVRAERAHQPVGAVGTARAAREHGRGRLRPLPDEPAVSAPMLSAAPGVLLAAELVKRHVGAEAPLSPRTNMVATSILTGPHERWGRRIRKRTDCTCQDPAYRAHYRSRWQEGAAQRAS